MGRYAQYRHRGRGASAPGPAFPEPAPLVGEWDVVQGGPGNGEATVSSAPGGVLYFEGRWRLSPAGEWTEFSGSVAVGDTLILATDGGLTDFQIRWSDVGDAPLSDGGDIKTLLIV